MACCNWWGAIRWVTRSQRLGPGQNYVQEENLNKFTWCHGGKHMKSPQTFQACFVRYWWFWLWPPRLRDDAIKWKHFPRYWPFVRGIHRSPVNSPHKGQWRGALIFSLICAWINGWANNREAGDLRRHHAHFDVIAMKWKRLRDIIPQRVVLFTKRFSITKKMMEISLCSHSNSNERIATIYCTWHLGKVISISWPEIELVKRIFHRILNCDGKVVSKMSPRYKSDWNERSFIPLPSPLGGNLIIPQILLHSEVDIVRVWPCCFAGWPQINKTEDFMDIIPCYCITMTS